jgi:hypothetical protein
MAASSMEAVFSVSVVKEIGKQKTILVKNAIKRISLKCNWQDLLDTAIDAISENDLPDQIVDKFQKLVTVEVSSSPNGETFHPDNNELIGVLYDFDKSLKYVTITFKLTGDEDLNNNALPPTKLKNAFSVLVNSNNISKPPPLIEKDRPRFTGKFAVQSGVFNVSDIWHMWHVSARYKETA